MNTPTGTVSTLDNMPKAEENKVNLTSAHLAELRNYLKEFKASSADAEHQGRADKVSDLVPAMVDAIHDDELAAITNDMWAYVMTNMINSAIAEANPAKENDVPETETEKLVSLA